MHTVGSKNTSIWLNYTITLKNMRYFVTIKTH